MTNSAQQGRRHVRTRVRYLPGLPQYIPADSEYVPSPRFDRMEVRRAYVLTGLDANLFDHPGELARAMRDDRFRPHRRFPRYDDFISLRDYSDGRYDGLIGVRRNHRAAGRIWLVGVKLRFAHLHIGGTVSTARELNHAPPIHVAVTAEINPTRIIAHAIQRGIDVETAAWQELLTSDEDTYRALCATSYDGGDNIIPATAFLQPVAEFHWVRLAARCLDALDEFVHYLLISERPRGAERLAYEPQLRSEGVVNIRSAEVHQEFRQLDAADTTRRMLPALRQTASNLAQSLWTEDEQYSPVASYTLRLTDLINLGIYAKAVDRIRMEVRFHTRVPSHGALRLEDRLMALAREAIERINNARVAIATRLGSLDRPLALGEAVGTLSELSGELGRFFSEDRLRHRRLLETLLTYGAVEAGPAKVITSDEAKRLVRLNVLDTTRIANRSRHGNRYPLAPHYAPLVGLFQLAVNGE